MAKAYTELLKKHAALLKEHIALTKENGALKTRLHMTMQAIDMYRLVALHGFPFYEEE